ncbi:uncharacterized protein LOC136092751 [Hydra vulgaris]|uniref:uncharacterized protein LOC136092751 n=1 Tax=Hydra vulgaris TaxID=6087 RepID=UPI0032EA6F9F
MHIYGDSKFNRCYWPPFARQESIDKAIHSSTACSILWAQHPIRLMAVADSYPKAVEKLKDAQYTSDLQTEVDEVYQRPKRKRKARQSLDDAENDSVDENVSSHNQETIKQSKKLKFHSQAPNVPPFLMDALVPGNSNTPDTNENFDSNFKDDFVVGDSSENSQNNNFASKYGGTGTEHFTTNIEFVFKNFAKQTFKIMAELKSTLLEVQSQVNLNTQHLQALTDGGFETADRVFEQLELPIGNICDFLDLNLKLSDKVLFKRLVVAVSSKGGSTLREAVKFMLRSMLNNTVLRNLNWTGQPPKTKFGNTKGHRVILNTIARNIPTRNSTECDIQKEIVRYIHGSNDRDSGRKERKKRRKHSTPISNITDIETSSSSNVDKAFVNLFLFGKMLHQF